MLCCCCPKTSRTYLLVVISIWIELGSGLVATTWTAFYSNHKKGVLPYIIFSANLIFSITFLFVTGQEVWIRLKRNHTKSPALNWLFVICTIATFSLFLIIFRYKTHVLDLTFGYHETKVLDRAFAVFMCTAYLLPLFYMICSVAPVFSELFPFSIFLIWIQLGSGLTITTWTTFFNEKTSGSNTWAYLIFVFEVAFASLLLFYTGNEIFLRTKRNASAKPTLTYLICGISTIATAVVFGLVWGHSAFIVGEKTLPKMFTDSLGIYIFSIYLLTLLECIPDGDTGDEDDYAKGVKAQDDNYDDTYGIPTNNVDLNEVVVLQYYAPTTPALNSCKSTRIVCIKSCSYQD